jgi:hypothetical protein
MHLKRIVYVRDNMSVSWSRSDAAEWNYRVTDRRLVIVKAKNVNVHKMAVMDVLTNLPFTIEVKERDVLESLSTEKEYLVDLKIYTSTNIEEVDNEFTNFFEVLDVDQKIEDFINAFWIYPTKIRFELADIEEP